MTKRRIFFTLCLTLLIVMSLGLNSMAEGTFASTRTYAEGTFTDVQASAWYYNDVVSAYELGLMNGMSEDSYGPDGSVTVGQGIAIAARVHNLYNGGTGEFVQGEPWYQVYVDYAAENGFLLAGQFDSYTRDAKRFEVATLFADALPSGAYAAINDVVSIPDIASNADYAEKILLLYNAGIIMGNDDYGTFYPQNSIKRSEISAIINRVALPENRIQKTLLEKLYGDAVYLIDAPTMTRGKNGITSGWDLDHRYQIMNTTGVSGAALYDTSNEMELFLRRPITPQQTGVMTLELTMNYSNAHSGAFLLFTDDNGEDTFKLYTKDSAFFAEGGDNTIELPFEYLNGTRKIKVIMDLDTKIGHVYIDGVDCGDVFLNPYATEVNKLIIGTTKEDVLTIIPTSVKLYTNYLINEEFTMAMEDTVPVEWNINGDFIVGRMSSEAFTVNSLFVDAAAGSKHSANKAFTATSGNVIFESYILLPVGTSGAYVSLNSGNDKIVTILSEGNTFVNGSGDFLRNYMSNIWQCLRIEANTVTQKALIRINGKTIGTFDFENTASFFDSVTIGFEPDSNAVFWFDDVQVFRYEEPADYVPAPVRPESAGYYIGMNVCSLWRNGHHTGWDAISAYPDLEPVLGFYDEGLVEVADWEIKIMVENGIDYQHLCWYSPSGDLKYPIKTSRMNDALHDGYFNAKYSDMLKFNFMWENSGQNVSSLEQFKEFLWSYWIEYYFTDDRFMTMDNKPVITVWSYAKFVSAFGGEEGAKEAIAFMKEDIKKLGFDGMIILFADGHSRANPFFANVAKIGADGTYGYHWNNTGKDADHQIMRMTTQTALNSTHIMPTVSVGFNSVGWHGIRYDLISLEGHREVINYIKNEHLPQYKNEADDWKHRALLVSTWNEYGEGTYVMPAPNLHGYGYMNNVRDLLTNATDEPDNLIPTPAQKARLGYLYPQTRSLVKLLDYEKDTEASLIPTGILKEWDFSKAADAAEWKDGFGITNFAKANGVISGVSEKDDFAFRTAAQDLELAIGKATHIHIRMKSSEIGTLEVFFTTDSDENQNQAKSKSVSVSKKDEFVDYYLDMSSISDWKGKLKFLRVDPLNKPSSFEISYIALLQPVDADRDLILTVNTQELLFDFAPIFENDEAYVTANPEKGFFSMLNLYYEFSRFSGRFYMKSANDTEFEFYVGKDTATVNGEVVNLGYEFYLRDGLPVLPIKLILDKAGYLHEIKDNQIKVVTIDPKYVEVLENRTPFQYEFNIPGDVEGWKAGNAAISVIDGAVVGVTIPQASNTGYPNFDPALTSPELNINSAAYPTIVVGLKHDYVPEDVADVVVIYFKTDSENSLDEKKTVKLPLEGASSNGKFIEYTFDMTQNERWAGTVTGIRFDPFNKEGTFEVDYIRFIRDESVKSTGPVVKTKNTTDSLVNGDAEDTSNVAFFSNNATISIIQDPDKAGNHVYKVNAKEGKNWVYTRQDVQFTPGKTYIVEFDVKIIGTNDGSTDVEEAQILLNTQYADEKSNDHVTSVIKLGTKDGWKHAKAEITIPETSDNRGVDQFAIYANPIGDLSVSYMLDNIKLTRK